MTARRATVLALTLAAALCAASGPGLASPPGPGGDELAALGRRLTALGRRTTTLRAEFVQRKRLRLFKTDVTTRGRIAYQRPDRLRWETLPPDASVLLVTGQRAEVRLPGERPRVIDLARNRTMGILVEQLMVWLGARPAGELTRHYEVQLQTRPDRGAQLQLIPRDAALRKRVKALAVTLDGALTIRSVEVTQPGGDSTLISFDKIERNAKLAPGLFH